MRYFTFLIKNLICCILIGISINTSAQDNEEINVIGVYAHWENSMCAQGCENIDLSHYTLTSPLKDLPLWTSRKTVFVEGSFKVEDQEYIVAGVEPNASLMGKTYKLRKIEVAQYRIFDFVTYSVDSVENEKREAGEDFVIELVFTNPSDRDVELKAEINNGEYMEFVLPASENFTLSYMTTVSDFNAYELKVLNTSVGHLSQKKAFKKAESEGFVVHYNQTIEL